MFALLALLCFVLALFHAHVGTLNLVTLGFVFLAASLVFAGPLLPAWPPRRR